MEYKVEPATATVTQGEYVITTVTVTDYDTYIYEEGDPLVSKTQLQASSEHRGGILKIQSAASNGTWALSSYQNGTYSYVNIRLARTHDAEGNRITESKTYKDYYFAADAPKNPLFRDCNLERKDKKFIFFQTVTVNPPPP